MKLFPIFPLELVVFPLEKFNLHIFEPRYRQLIKDCDEEGILFGIPVYRKNEPMKYGSIVRLLNIEKVHNDGRMDIKTEGIQLFELKEYMDLFPGKMYPGGYINPIELDLDQEMYLNEEIKKKIMYMYEFMNIKKIPKPLQGDGFFTFEIAHKVGFNKDQEYEFLQIPKEKDRQHYLLEHLERLIPIAKEMEEMRKKVQLNGHFKDVLPPKV